MHSTVLKRWWDRMFFLMNRQGTFVLRAHNLGDIQMYFTQILLSVAPFHWSYNCWCPCLLRAKPVWVPFQNVGETLTQPVTDCLLTQTLPWVCWTQSNTALPWQSLLSTLLAVCAAEGSKLVRNSLLLSLWSTAEEPKLKWVKEI